MDGEQAAAGAEPEHESAIRRRRKLSAGDVTFCRKGAIEFSAYRSQSRYGTGHLGSAEHRYPLGHQPDAEGQAVARRRFEMFQFRQILVRLRQGDTDREIARSGLMGRRKAAAFRALCQQQGWLEPASVLPEDAALAAAVGHARRARSTISSAEQHRELVARWVAQGVRGCDPCGAAP
jgi:hypothetical protein